MISLPSNIAKTYEKLKHEYPFYVTTKRINGKYYLYKAFTIWNADEKKYTVTSEYLGRFTGDGKYIKKKTQAKSDLENAKALIEKSGGRVLWGKRREPDEMPLNEKVPSATDAELALLMALSMNARAPVSLLAERTGLGRSAVLRRIKKTEQRFKVKYILETDPSKFGFLSYLILIRFDDAQPPVEDLKAVLGKEAKIQFAAMLKGDYDLMIYFLETDQIKAGDFVWEFRSTTMLGNYSARWYIMPFGQAYSFVPLRNEFIYSVLGFDSEKTKLPEVALLQKMLKRRELVVLKELNENSVKSFAEIDEQHGLGKGSARYAYYGLKERGVIVRPTINIEMPMKYVGVVLLETINAADTRRTIFKLLLDDIKYGEITNKYCLIGNIGSPEGSVNFLPITKDGDLENARAYMEQNVIGSRFKTLIVSAVLVGSLCYRRFDNAYSRQSETLVMTEKINRQRLTIYE